jgi:trans-2,3-dihydro-3-hydroxyanthranilate isomerase
LLILEEGIGPVECEAAPVDATRGRAHFRLPQLPSEVGPAAENAAIAAALGLSVMDIGFDTFVPARFSAGLPFTFVPLRGIEAVRRCRPDLAQWDAAFGADRPRAAFVFCRETEEPGHAFHARMFAPCMGIPEDPATGSAAAALAGVLMRFSPPGDGDHAFAIEQGYEMKRPSRIELSLSVRGGALATASIGGEAVLVTEGMIDA